MNVTAGKETGAENQRNEEARISESKLFTQAVGRSIKSLVDFVSEFGELIILCQEPRFYTGSVGMEKPK
jgi:hypothetical protein